MLILSDPVDLNVPPGGDLAVSLYFASETGPPTTHATALHTTYIKDGDVTGQAAMPDAVTTQSYYWLAGIDVAAGSEASVVVAFGDSITDGARSSPESNHSWPALLQPGSRPGKIRRTSESPTWESAATGSCVT